MIIAAPNGDLVPAKITQQPGGDYQLEYLTKFTGKYLHYNDDDDDDEDGLLTYLL